MREDQKQQLDDLAESLMDVFLTEADPSNWSGAGQSPAEMDKDTRGARNWDAKNANQVGALVARALDLKDRLTGANQAAQPETPDDAAEHDIAKYERHAREVMKRAGITAGGR